MSKVKCPACDKEISVKGIAKHVNGCAYWDEEIGIPPSEFNFDKHFKRGLYADGLKEGVDYTQCKICLSEGKDVRKKRLMDHIKKHHGLSEKEYSALHPGAPVRLPRTKKLRQATVEAKYGKGVKNVFQAKEVRKKAETTSLKKYGTKHASQAKDVVKRRKETNRKRYGADNPFGSKQIQKKIRDGWIQNHGVTNPNQLPEVVERRIQTNLEKYGVEHYLQTDEFQTKYRQSAKKNWGEEHPMKSEDGKERLAQTMRQKYGVDSPFQSPEIQRKAYETNLRNHGGKHSQQCEEVLEKARQTWLEKYGVDNPSKVESVKMKIKDTWMRNYGVPFPPQSLWVNREVSFPNKLEQRFDKMSPEVVVYTGDGSYWLRPKSSSRSRNPDFVVLTQEQLSLYKQGADINTLRTSRIAEIFGDYWHGPSKTGKSRQEHKKEVIDFYKACGVTCLVLWESEINKRPKLVHERLKRFLNPGV